ncbi:MAG: hypothetical protein MZV64_52605 [Ignavibacteriales bacterium]|nr:hypothetical protein [Ignavibacteriales bacterium]
MRAGPFSAAARNRCRRDTAGSSRLKTWSTVPLKNSRSGDGSSSRGPGRREARSSGCLHRAGPASAGRSSAGRTRRPERP